MSPHTDKALLLSFQPIIKLTNPSFKTTTHKPSRNHLASLSSMPACAASGDFSLLPLYLLNFMVFRIRLTTNSHLLTVYFPSHHFLTAQVPVQAMICKWVCQLLSYLHHSSMHIWCCGIWLSLLPALAWCKYPSRTNIEYSTTATRSILRLLSTFFFLVSKR